VSPYSDETALKPDGRSSTTMAKRLMLYQKTPEGAVPIRVLFQTLYQNKSLLPQGWLLLLGRGLGCPSHGFALLING
jgi:hypothetical protein